MVQPCSFLLLLAFSAVMIHGAILGIRSSKSSVGVSKLQIGPKPVGQQDLPPDAEGRAKAAEAEEDERSRASVSQSFPFPFTGTGATPLGQQSAGSSCPQGQQNPGQQAVPGPAFGPLGQQSPDPCIRCDTSGCPQFQQAVPGPAFGPLGQQSADPCIMGDEPSCPQFQQGPGPQGTGSTFDQQGAFACLTGEEPGCEAGPYDPF